MAVQELTEQAQQQDTGPASRGEQRGKVGGTIQKRATDSGTAKFLGWFSVGLGLAEILFPKKLAGLMGTPVRKKLTRVMGVREVAAGIGILTSSKPAPWIRARVAGDALDLTLLGAASTSRGSEGGRLAGSAAFVAAVTALDIVTVRELSGDQSRIHLQSTIAVNRSPEDCYRFWRKIENFPSFMEHLDAVHVTGEKTSRWRVKGPASHSLEWEAEITRDTPGEEIAWRSLPGGELDNAGSVTFEPRITGKGTMVRLSMAFEPPVAGAGTLSRGFLRTISKHEVREDLRRFKSVIEAGEAPTTKGQTSGRGVQQS